MSEARAPEELDKHVWRRGAIDILVDVLVVASKGAKKTDIVYKTNLNFKVAKRYLDFLLLKKLIVTDGSQGRRKLYITTDRGKMFVRRHKEALDLIS